MLYLMIAVALLGFAVAVERFFYLHKGKIRSKDFVTGIVNLLKKGRTVEALSLCEETPGPVAAIVKVGLLNVRRSAAEMMLSLQGAAAAEVPLLEKRVNSLLFFSRMVQLLGVLGALIAMREPFMQLSRGGELLGVNTFAAVTALAMGWLIAGVALGTIFYAVYHLLNGRVKALVAEMERAAVELQSQMQNVRLVAEVENTGANTGDKANNNANK